MAKGRQKGFKLHSYTNCIVCGGDFTSITYCSKGYCKTCYNAAYRKRTTPQPYDRLDYIGKTMSLLSKEECIRWISKQYDNRFFTDMKGLSDLIHVYDSMGGLQQTLDDMKPGKQLQMMWDYVNKKFLNEYKELIKLDI